MCSNKLKSRLNLTAGTLPSDVEMSVQAVKHHSHNKYVPPARRQPTAGDHPATSHNQLSVDKAPKYKGKLQTESLLRKFGYSCHYCLKPGHWYADCDDFWDHVRLGVISPPPADHADRGSRYVPPPRPSNVPIRGGHIRQLELDAISEGQILFDSGSTAHVADADEERDDPSG